MQHRPPPVVVVGLAVLSGWLTACSNDPAAGPATTPGRASSTLAPTRQGTPVTLDASPQAIQQQVQAATTATKDIIFKTAGALGLKPAEAACLAKRLDAAPELRDALGDNPTTSPRYEDLAALSQDCIRVATSALNFATSINDQTGGTLDTATVACLRDEYAALTPDQIGAIVQGLNPGTVDPAVNQQLDTIFGHCNIDRAKLPQPPR